MKDGYVQEKGIDESDGEKNQNKNKIYIQNLVRESLLIQKGIK